MPLTAIEYLSMEDKTETFTNLSNEDIFYAVTLKEFNRGRYRGSSEDTCELRRCRESIEHFIRLCRAKR